MDNSLYEAWVVIDTKAKHTDECVVAIFSTEAKLFEFVKEGRSFFDQGRFVVQAKVSIDPNHATSIELSTSNPKRVQ